MNPVVRRILVTGAAAAVGLAAFGYVLTDFAVILQLGPPAERAFDAELAAANARDLRTRVPVALALWGFGLVAAYEGVLYLLRGNPPPAAPPEPKPPADTDTVLTDLLARAEAARADENRVAANPSCPPAPGADNTPTPAGAPPAAP